MTALDVELAQLRHKDAAEADRIAKLVEDGKLSVQTARDMVRRKLKHG